MPRVTPLLFQAILPPPPGATTTTTATPLVTPATAPAATSTLASTPTAIPPGVSPSADGVETWIVILVVVVVIGGVVLVAWLLKPVVARRLLGEPAGADGAQTATAERPATSWPDTWEQTRQGVETGPVAAEVAPGTETPLDEIVLPDAVEARRDEIDAEEIVGITLKVRELLEFANSGQLLRGFGLYSESSLARFRAETGLSDEEFTATFEAVPAPPPEARAELAAVADLETLPDGRISALITYSDGGASPPPERFIFVRVGERWLIDDIVTGG